MNRAIEELYIDLVDMYLDFVCDFYIPNNLTDELYGFILDVEKDLNQSPYYKVYKYSDSQPRDDHGRWTDGGGSSGSSSSGQLSDSNPDFHPTSEEIINSVPEITAFDSEELNHVVHTSCKDILMAIKDDIPGTEATISISLDLTQKSEIQKGEPGAGTVNPIRMNVPYVSIHNHASGDTFSDRDIRKFVVDTNAKAICVIGNNGRIYILQKNKDFNWIQFGIKTHTIDDDYNYNLQVLRGADKYGLQYYKK